jgi:hypothetical protein
MERARRAVAAVVAAALLGGLGGASPSLPERSTAAGGDRAAIGSTGSTATGASSASSLAAPAGRSSRSFSATHVDVPAAAGDAVIAPPPETFGADLPAAPAPPPQELFAPEAPDAFGDGGVWAVIIGVNDYPGRAGDLRSAVNDANDMDEALGRLGVPPGRRLVLRDGEATAAVIGAAADWLTARAGPDATAVFFYAGHVRKTGGGSEAIVAADGSLVSDGSLAARLAPLRARLWLVMASCFGGGFTELLGPGRVLTAAADADSLAYENSGFGRSYLVQYMVRRGLIEGRAGATAQEAYAYADAALRQEYPNRTPFQLDESGAPLALSMSTGAPAPPPPPPPPAGGGDPESGSGGDPPPRPKDESPPPENDGKCAGLKLGVVTCGP